MTEPTPEQQVEMWFKDVMGWEWHEGIIEDYRIIKNQGWYEDGKCVWGIKKLPPIATSLDAQETHVWPTLREMDIWKSTLQQINNETVFFLCELGFKDVVATASTKPLAQLKAALKAKEVL